MCNLAWKQSLELGTDALAARAVSVQESQPPQGQFQDGIHQTSLPGIWQGAEDASVLDDLQGFQLVEVKPHQFVEFVHILEIPHAVFEVGHCHWAALRVVSCQELWAGPAAERGRELP